MRNIMDLAGGTLVISSPWWITGGWNEENELWSINLFVHHYPLSHAPSVCLSVSESLSVSSQPWIMQKLSNAPWRHPTSPGRLSAFSFHRLSGSWERDKAAPWWYHRYWVSEKSSPVRWEGGEGRGAGEGRQKRPKGVDRDLFVPEWWPILPGQRPGELLGVRHFSTAARCWDVEGWCGQRELLSYWDRGGLAWFAWCPEAFGGQ